MKKEEVEEKVARVVEEAQAESNHLIRLSSGVVLRGKQAPPLALVKVMAAFTRPKPPVYFNETMGREVENPDDPDYIARVQAYQTESSNAILNALILLGTELAETPKKFPKPEDDDWLEEYRELGLTPRMNKSWRYLTWVTFKAVLNEHDLELIRDEVGRLSGVPESAVQSAEAFPRGNKNGRKS